MHPAFARRMTIVAARFDELMACPSFTRDDIPASAKAGGVYLFSEGETHLYIGRSKNIQKRLLLHSRPGVVDAPFAFRRARYITGKGPSYKKEGSRLRLLEDDVFFAIYQEQKLWIAALSIRFVLEADS